MADPVLSVVICSHNSRPEHLRRTLAALANQTMPRDQFEVLVVDNASSTAPDVATCPGARIVPEPRLGIQSARLRGFAESRGQFIAMVDDDNVLDPDYLERAVLALESHPTWGMLGGRNFPEFEVPPPEWLATTGIGVLACRDPGDTGMVASWREGEWRNKFPWFSPVGAGMVMRREVADLYVKTTARDPIRLRLDRVGTALTSGGDNDIVLTALEADWEVAYVPELRLLHLIGAGRLTLEYQARLHRGCNRSWVLLLSLHGICPWPPVPAWTVPLRVAKAWCKVRPWSSAVRRIRWSALRGLFEGRADVRRILGPNPPRRH